MNIIPATFVGAFTDGAVLPVLLISVLCAFALTRIGAAGKSVVDFIEAASKMLFAVVGIVMWTAPIGAFGAIAFTVGRFGAGSLLSLGKLLGGFYVTCLIFIFGVLWPVAAWCGFSIFRLIRYIREELLIVFATTSSETVLPQLMRKLELLGCEESIVGLVIPTGYSFNLDGTCLYLATTTVFLAQATNTHLGIWQQIGLAGGAASVVKGSRGRGGSGVRRAGRDDCNDRNDSGRKRRTGARDSPAHVGGIDADERGGKRRGDDCGFEVGKLA